MILLRMYSITATSRLTMLFLLFIQFASCQIPDENIIIENNSFKYGIGSTGKNLYFTDKINGIDYLDMEEHSFSASVMKEGKEIQVTKATLDNGLLHYEFGDPSITADLRLTIAEDHIVFTVIAMKSEVENFTFINVPLTIEGLPSDQFAACVLSMNLRTHVFQLPALQTHLKATSYQRFGIEKSEVTMLGVPQKEILPAIRNVMSNAEDLPLSSKGGAWAKLSKENYGSYLMNFGTLTKETVPEWVQMCKDLGFNQIYNHGGQKFFKFGGFELDSIKWPGGWDNFKQINKQLHDEGISSIFHTYAFFIDKQSRYVTPVPREDLGYFNQFTLEEPINTKGTEITIKESTADITMTTGFAVRNSRTIRIGKELIEFSGVTKTPPYKFTGCKRGMHGTTTSSYMPGEKAYHLRELFGLFLPGPDTPLFTEIAKRTAEIVDQVDFDGIYFDAIDGSDLVAGQENSWYYGGKFVLEVAKHLKRPVRMWMSTMTHHWWHYRSSWQAWDRPTRGYKRFIDIHLASMKDRRNKHSLWRGNTAQINKLAASKNGGLLLPLELGWWAHQSWNPPQVEPTFPDDIEYLGAKMIGNNAGLSMIGGFDQKTLEEIPAFQRLNSIIRQYENLRQSDYFDESIRKQLRETGKEFTLFQDEDENWNFRPATYHKHKVAGLSHQSANWTVLNEYGTQHVKLRIEPLMSVKAFDDPSNVTLTDFTMPMDFTQEAANGVSGGLATSSEKTTSGLPSVSFHATSNGDSPQDASWKKMEKKFDPILNLEKNQGLGVWVKGDGNGQLLNLRLESPYNISHGAWGDHFIKIDFLGWKYFELIEIESSEFSKYIWPLPSYSNPGSYVYNTYRNVVSFNKIDKLQIWYNNLPIGIKVNVMIGPIKAIPLVSTTIRNPSITIGGEQIVFPVSMESGMYLEYKSAKDCKLYGPKGEFLRDVVPIGSVLLKSGKNKVSFNCDGPKEVNPRVQVTCISEGKPLVKY
ncbi:hypothetical protein KO529_04790 [Arenibacter algicola]|uniref:hypothetical protein n=1 Tax=Arenibacter algicola TaxID=616991 RepID=UPI001C06BFD3|nr:hypothetical protein [Arenibacter algicola]MBU2904092.1 hypothetical protein [Arenibacter algicola]